MAAGWPHRWPLVVTLHNQAGRWGNWGLLGGAVYCGAPRIRQPPMPHRATVVTAGPPQARPPAHPRPDHQPTPGPTTSQPWRTCSAHRYAAAQTPWYHWLASWPLDKQGRLGHGRATSRTARATPGGVLEPRRVCVTHSHFWAKILTPNSPRSPFTFLGQNSRPKLTTVHHRPPPSTTVHPLPPTTHTWLIEVNKGCAKVSIGCMAVGLYVPASAVQKTIGDYR